MTDRPILFSAPMVRALLAGTKTQTRRLIKPTSQTDGFTMYPQYLNGERIGSSSDPSFYDLSEFAVDPSNGLYNSGAPYCPGDRLWVREAWAPLSALTHNDPGVQALADRGFYRADGGTVDGEISRWRPGIHMPRWASRLTLTVTEVRVQRLQEISKEDAIAEGIVQHGRFYGLADADWDDAVLDPREAYGALWNSINAKRAPWDSNPWVCAITFKTTLGNIDQVRS